MKEQKALKINTRVLKSGNMVEVWRYEEPSIIGIQRRQREYSFERSDEEKLDKRNKNAMESWHKFIRLVTSNFIKGRTRFITLTFADSCDFDITDVEQCNAEFTKFMKRLRRRYGDNFRYLATIEFQEKNNRQAIHYHVLSDIGYIDAKELSDIWGLGFVKINLVSNTKHAAVYAGKYMRKGLLDMRLIGKKAYWSSLNLRKPKVLLNETAEQFLDSIKSLEMEKCPESSYLSEHNGIIHYNKFFVID